MDIDGDDRISREDFLRFFSSVSDTKRHLSTN